MMRFDRFTEKAQEAAMRSYEILQQYKHTQVDTEHVFLALLGQDGGAVPQIMKQLDAPVAEMVQKLTATLRTCRAPASTPTPTANTAQVFITPRLKRVMDVAYEEAAKLKDEYISTEHMSSWPLPANATRPAPTSCARRT
jgi:ATP-dependent Clp protease ATP-binding subunit ClpC